MFHWSLFQGQGGVFSVSLDACPLVGNETILGKLFDGSTGPPNLAFAVGFADSGPPIVTTTLTGAQTATLAPGGYVVSLGLASGGGELARGTATVYPSPGENPLFDSLAAPARFLQMYPPARLDADMLGSIPLALRTATALIRRLCYRSFTKSDHTEYLFPSLEGQCRLKEFPVNTIYRLSRQLTRALSISADPLVNQIAYVNYIAEDANYSLPSNQKFVGINLNSVSNGVASTHPILFADTPMLSDLAAAVNAFSGWKASADYGFTSWPVSEIYCDGTSQGAVNDGVSLQVFAKDVSTSRVDRRTGMLWSGYSRYGDGFGPRWGPDWMAWDDNGLDGDVSVVRVSYNAGFSSIPDPVQQATVELAKLIMNRMQIDYTLKKESIGDYSYEMNDFLRIGVPDPIRQSLAPYISYQA